MPHRQCQMPGCKNIGIKATKKEGIFCGVHLENVMIYTCGKHQQKDIMAELEKVGEQEANLLQHDHNPFVDVSFLTKTA